MFGLQAQGSWKDASCVASEYFSWHKYEPSIVNLCWCHHWLDMSHGAAVAATLKHINNGHRDQPGDISEEPESRTNLELAIEHQRAHEVRSSKNAIIRIFEQHDTDHQGTFLPTWFQ